MKLSRRQAFLGGFFRQNRAKPRFYAKNGHLPGEEAFRQTSADISDGAADVSDGAAEVSDGAADVSDGAAEASDGAAGVSDGAAGVSDGAAEVSGMAAEPGDTAAGARPVTGWRIKSGAIRCND
jgi:X-X-X-Leu-X-X-Gly heptad repeat protein